MSHSFTKLWIHAIWATKNRKELIDYQIGAQSLSQHSPRFQPCVHNGNPHCYVTTGFHG